jgi:hypothetical protein
MEAPMAKHPRQQLTRALTLLATPSPKKCSTGDVSFDFPLYSESMTPCSAQEGLADRLRYDKEMAAAAMESSRTSESWKLNGGQALVVSPKELTTLSSVITSNTEEATREWEGHFLDVASDIDEATLLKFRDGQLLVERLQKRKRTE